MAKELAWKASKVLKPRGFESHALRQKKKMRFHASSFSFLSQGMEREPERASSAKKTIVDGFQRDGPSHADGEGRQMRPKGADAKSHAQLNL